MRVTQDYQLTEEGQKQVAAYLNSQTKQNIELVGSDSLFIQNMFYKLIEKVGKHKEEQ